MDAETPSVESSSEARLTPAAAAAPTPGPRVGGRERGGRRGVWAWARRVTLATLLAAAGLVLLARWTGAAESIAFYHPSRRAFETPMGVEDVSITTPDGATLHGWFLRARDAEPGERRPAVLHVHGNAGRLPNHARFTAFLTGAGFHVMLFDYRGYGRSSADGWLGRQELLTDSLAAFDALAGRDDVDASRLGIHGFSLGGTFALNVAARRPEARAVASVATFATWPAVADDHVPVLGALLVPPGLDAAEAASKLGQRPVLVLHGSADEVVPARHAGMIVERARAAGVACEQVIIGGARHENVLEPGSPGAEALVEFFVRTLGVGASAPGEAPGR